MSFGINFFDTQGNRSFGIGSPNTAWFYQRREFGGVFIKWDLTNNRVFVNSSARNRGRVTLTGVPFPVFGNPVGLSNNDYKDLSSYSASEANLIRRALFFKRGSGPLKESGPETGFLSANGNQLVFWRPLELSSNYWLMSQVSQFYMNNTANYILSGKVDVWNYIPRIECLIFGYGTPNSGRYFPTDQQYGIIVRNAHGHIVTNTNWGKPLLIRQRLLINTRKSSIPGTFGIHSSISQPFIQANSLYSSAYGSMIVYPWSGSVRTQWKGSAWPSHPNDGYLFKSNVPVLIVDGAEYT